jgi:hypothetical protein
MPGLGAGGFAGTEARVNDVGLRCANPTYGTVVIRAAVSATARGWRTLAAQEAKEITARLT